MLNFLYRRRESGNGQPQRAGGHAPPNDGNPNANNTGTSKGGGSKGGGSKGSTSLGTGASNGSQGKNAIKGGASRLSQSPEVGKGGDVLLSSSDKQDKETAMRAMLERARYFATSTLAVQRTVFGKELCSLCYHMNSCEHAYQHLIQPYLSTLAWDPETDVRKQILTQFGDLAGFLIQSNPEVGYAYVLATLVPVFPTLLLDPVYKETRGEAAEALLVLASHLRLQERTDYALRTVLSLSNDNDDDSRALSAFLLNGLAPTLTKELCVEFCAIQLIALGEDRNATVRKAVLINIKDIAHCAGKKFCSTRLWPTFEKLCNDSQYLVRKTATEYIALLIETSNRIEDCMKLTKKLVMADSNRWVRLECCRNFGYILYALQKFGHEQLILPGSILGSPCSTASKITTKSGLQSANSEHSDENGNSSAQDNETRTREEDNDTAGASSAGNISKESVNDDPKKDLSGMFDELLQFYFNILPSLVPANVPEEAQQEKMVYNEVRYHLGYTFSAVLESVLPYRHEFHDDFQKMFVAISESKEQRTRATIACSLWKIDHCFQTYDLSLANRLTSAANMGGVDEDTAGFLDNSLSTTVTATIPPAAKKRSEEQPIIPNRTQTVEESDGVETRKGQVRELVTNCFNNFISDKDEIKIGLAKNIGNFEQVPEGYLQGLSKMINLTENWRLRLTIATTSLPALCQKRMDEDTIFHSILPTYLKLLHDGVALVRSRAAAASHLVLQAVCVEARRGYVPPRTAVQTVFAMSNPSVAGSTSSSADVDCRLVCGSNEGTPKQTEAMPRDAATPSSSSTNAIGSTAIGSAIPGSPANHPLAAGQQSPDSSTKSSSFNGAPIKFYSTRTKKIINHLRKQFKDGTSYQNKITYIKIVDALIRDGNVSRKFVHFFLHPLADLASDKVRHVRLQWALLVGPHLRPNIGKCCYHRRLVQAAKVLQTKEDPEVRRALNFTLPEEVDMHIARNQSNEDDLSDTESLSFGGVSPSSASDVMPEDLDEGEDDAKVTEVFTKSKLEAKTEIKPAAKEMDRKKASKDGKDAKSRDKTASKEKERDKESMDRYLKDSTKDRDKDSKDFASDSTKDSKDRETTDDSTNDSKDPSSSGSPSSKDRKAARVFSKETTKTSKEPGQEFSPPKRGSSSTAKGETKPAERDETSAVDPGQNKDEGTSDETEQVTSATERILTTAEAPALLIFRDPSPEGENNEDVDDTNESWPQHLQTPLHEQKEFRSVLAVADVHLEPTDYDKQKQCSKDSENQGEDDGI